MTATFFITGTDTDAGKTLIACALLHLANERGLNTLGLKPLAAGSVDTEAGPRNDDALLLQQAASLPLDYSLVNPVLLKEPMAPHIAAANEGRRLSMDRMLGFVRGALSSRPQGLKPEFVVVEGAGGWKVPINPSETMADLAKELNAPVILVIGMKLGCLNHALLSAEAIHRDGLKIAGWVATVVDPNMAAVEENLNALKHLLPFRLLGFIPWLAQANSREVANYLDISSLNI